MAWTTPATWPSGDWNLQIRDNLNYIHQWLPPIGTTTLYAVEPPTAPPTGWAYCNGASQSTTGDYADLFALIGYKFGGSGSNFSLPNIDPAVLGGTYGLFSFIIRYA